MTQHEESLLVLGENNSGAEVVVLKQRRTHSLIISTTVKWSLVVMVLFTSAASAQSVQTIDSEAQLAYVLCRKPKEDKTNELLLDKNTQLVNVTLWNTLLDCASTTQRQESPAQSIEIYKLILSVAERLNKPELVASTYYYLGRTYSRTNDLANSIQAYEASRKVFEQAGSEGNLTYVLGDLGVLYLTADDYEKAQSYARQSLAIVERMKSSRSKAFLGPNEYGEARSLQALGAIDLVSGKHAEAIKKLDDALRLHKRLDRLGFSYNAQMAEVLIAVARAYGEMGRYGNALSSLSKAHQVSRSSGDKNTSANIMSNQAVIFLEQEDYAAAQKYLNASLAIYRSLGNTREEARVLLNLATLEQRQGLHNEALHLFQQSMQRAQTTNLVDVQIAAGAGVGVALTAKGDFPNGLNAIKQSIGLARRANAKTREIEVLWRAAQTYYAMQDYRQSAAVAEEALTLARSLRLPKLTYLSAATLGEAYAAEGKSDLAIATFKEAVSLVEELRAHATGRQGRRQLFFENKLGSYHKLVGLLTKQGNVFEALLYAERAKGRLLLESVRRNTRDLQNVLTPAEKVELERLHDRVLAVYQRIQSVSDNKSAGELNNELDAAKREFTAFEKTLVATYPELLLRTGLAQPLTNASLSNLVRADGILYLEYVSAGDHIGVFTLKRNGVTQGHELKYIRLPVNAEELRRKVNEFHAALAERSPVYVPLGRELYRLLIEPVANELQNINTICIIPDEFLWTLPFQALTTTKQAYFIQEYALYYAPSLSVLNEMMLRRRQQSSNESLIAFGNPVIERKITKPLHPIPETQTEAIAVAAAVKTRMKRVLVGREADEKTFKALAPQYATIHLATHGVLDNRDPLNSYLLLTKTDEETENEGLLQAREIIDMHLDADLAVLSACETGNGRISPGEGVIGMSWAFLVAGARSVVVSQWRVNSASTSQLMKNFYHVMAKQKDLKGPHKSQALREASLRLLSDRRYRHPFYWAGFVLVSSN
jgi:CHAT domain-containing protein